MRGVRLGMDGGEGGDETFSYDPGYFTGQRILSKAPVTGRDRDAAAFLVPSLFCLEFPRNTPFVPSCDATRFKCTCTHARLTVDQNVEFPGQTLNERTDRFNNSNVKSGNSKPVSFFS